MNANKTSVRTLAWIGAGAVVALGALGTSLSNEPQGSPVAGSGHSATISEYSNPNVPSMNEGATQVWAAPATTEATMSAAPPVKAK